MAKESIFISLLPVHFLTLLLPQTTADKSLPACAPAEEEAGSPDKIRQPMETPVDVSLPSGMDWKLCEGRDLVSPSTMSGRNGGTELAGGEGRKFLLLGLAHCGQRNHGPQRCPHLDPQNL